MVQVARKRKRVTDVTKKKTYGTINKCNEFIYQIRDMNRQTREEDE